MAKSAYATEKENYDGELSQYIAFRAKPELEEGVMNRAEEEGMSKSEMIRELLRIGLSYRRRNASFYGGGHTEGGKLNLDGHVH